MIHFLQFKITFCFAEVFLHTSSNFSLSRHMKDKYIKHCYNKIWLVQFSRFSVKQNKMWFWINPQQALVTHYLVPKIHIALVSSIMCYIIPGSHRRSLDILFMCDVQGITKSQHVYTRISLSQSCVWSCSYCRRFLIFHRSILLQDLSR